MRRRDPLWEALGQIEIVELLLWPILVDVHCVVLGVALGDVDHVKHGAPLSR